MHITHSKPQVPAPPPPICICPQRQPNNRYANRMKSMSSTAPKTEASDKKTNEKKWTKLAMDAGWTAFPSVILERQKALGLDAIDVNIIMHLAMYWWTEDNKPHPSKGTIAIAMGIDPRTVQRRIAKMEAHGLIRREQRRIAKTGSKTNLYHLDGLIAAIQPFAQEKVEEIAKKTKERDDRAKRKRPKLQLVPAKDD